MSIQKILEYQEIDLEYLKLENQLRNCDEAKKLKECETQYKAATDEVMKCNLLVDDCFSNVDKYQKQFVELKKEVVELSNSVDEDIETAQLDYYSKKLEQLMTTIANIEKECDRLTADLKKLQDAAANEMKKASKSLTLAKQFKDAYLEKQKELSAKAKEIKEKRDIVEKDVDEEVLEIYKKVRKNKKVPFFVPLVSPKTCGGCGMEIANDLLEILNSGKQYAECPNCGRIIFKKD